MKYRDWLDVWLKNYVKPTEKRRTYERYSQIVEQHIIGNLGEEELDDNSDYKASCFVRHYFLEVALEL